MLKLLYGRCRGRFLAKIAVTAELNEPGRTLARPLAAGSGWTVSDVICTCGPRDRAYEERHSGFTIAIVCAGTFQYHSFAGRALMTPGSLLLGNDGQGFECSHEHGTGDRCLAFHFESGYFTAILGEAGAGQAFRTMRLPPLRALALLIARAFSAPRDRQSVWEEIGVDLAIQTAKIASGSVPDVGSAPAGATARVSQIVRRIEQQPGCELGLGQLACEARLSPYHFLRTFQQLTGLTPHQYILRTRLRQAAVRLATETEKILEIALECGFGDVSNFNRAFRTEFGLSPRAFRQAWRRSDRSKTSL